MRINVDSNKVTYLDFDNFFLMAVEMIMMSFHWVI